ncbi:hypothetical protein HHI36_000563 [Cryptolaemus montrouzieri]|uniref:GB1/RHD3-type G domain-containing protein n=1 Tax=Cryptolaemus montrouzieri TaxID=559131 RepID=A0ABD2P5D6_9CUCU
MTAHRSVSRPSVSCSFSIIKMSDSNEQRKHGQKIESGTGDMDHFEVNRPNAIPIVLANNDHSFYLDEDALSKVLMQDNIKDRNVVVISVAGAFRHGKSFLLDFFLRYMNSKYVLKKNTSDWIGLDDTPLDGFSWRGGSERDTTGILMWSEIFLTELVTGEKVSPFF